MDNIEAKVNGKTTNQIKPKRPAYSQLEKPYLEMIKYQKDNKRNDDKDGVCAVFNRINPDLGKKCRHQDENISRNYQNTCAAKMSWAINEGNWSSLLRKDFQDTKGRPYILSVLGMINRLKSKFGNSDIKFGNNISKFKNDIFGKKGIIVFLISGWGDANGHVTLWNGSLCIDDSNYFVPSEKYSVIDLFFWELKD